MENGIAGSSKSHENSSFVKPFLKMEIMEVAVIKIGNSKGIRLSKTLLEKYNIQGTVELILEKGQIVIKPISRPRKGWEKAFKKMTANGDDQLLIKDVFEDENLEEWK